MTEQRSSSFSLSPSTLLAASMLLFLAILLWQLRSLLVILMVAVVLAAALAPFVDRAERLRIPRFLAVILAYLLLGLFLTSILLLIGPTVIEQIQLLLGRLPGYLEATRSFLRGWLIGVGASESEALAWFDRLFNLQALTGWVIRSSQQVLVRSYDLTKAVVRGLISFVLAILISGYMLAGSQGLVRGLVDLLPAPWNDRVAAQMPNVGQRMGVYIQGRVLVSSILGIAITIGLNFLGLSEFSLGLGAIAAVTNLIPFFGPILGSIPALIVAAGQSGGWTLVWVLLLFVVIQNVETYLLDPLLVGDRVRVTPLYQLLAVLGGTQVLGIIGALIVPAWVAGGAVLLEELYIKPKQNLEAARQETEITSARSKVMAP
ncbi:MAG: AI-2E family transporter [Cyanobacteria bacterium J06641_5]